MRDLKALLFPGPLPLVLLLLALTQTVATAAWWETPHDKWYFKDDWKGAQVNNFSKTINLLSPATNGWIIIWGDQGVQLKVNGTPVMKHVDRGLIYDASLNELIRGKTEVKVQAGSGGIVAEGEILDDQGRRYPFASGCDWSTPVAPGTKLAPAAKPYRPGEASGAFNSAHNGLLIGYNDEERGKADIAKGLGRIQKLRDQSIFLLRRYRPAEDILDFSPGVLWRKAETYANSRILQAEKILKDQAIPAQKADNHRKAISFATNAAQLLEQAELAINSARELEQGERQQIHLHACAELIQSILPNSANTAGQLKQSLAELKAKFSAARQQAAQDKWDSVRTSSASATSALAPIETQLTKLWGSPLGKLDEFPEDRYGWFNAQRLLMNDPAKWEFTTVNPAANWIDLTGLWSFKVDPANKGEEQGWHKPGLSEDGWQRLQVPGEWEREGITQENDYAPWDCPYRLGDIRCEDKPYNGYAWYRREVLIPKTWGGKKVVLHIEKVSNWLRVYCNGKQVGEPKRDGGVFVLPNDLLKPGEKNTIAIQVYNHDNFGGIVGGPVSLSVDDVQPEVVVTPGPLSWTYETTVQTEHGPERTVAFASQMSPAVVLASEQDTLHLWGWEAKGYNPGTFPSFKPAQDKTSFSFEMSGPMASGSVLGEDWLALPFDVPLAGMGPLVLIFEKRPASITWDTNHLGYLELTLHFSSKGVRTLVYRLDGETWPHEETFSSLAQRLRSVPVGCSELARLDKKKLHGEFFLKYHHLEFPSPGQNLDSFAPLPRFLFTAIGNRLPQESLRGFQVCTPASLLEFTGFSRIGLGYIHYASEQDPFTFRPNTTTFSYTTPLIDKSKLLKGVGELFAKRRPEFNARGGNTEQQMFDDWKTWGFDHCRYAFAWGADWDLPLQKRMGGPITDDPALWDRLDYLVKQHTDRGIMAMLCYFFNEDAPQRDSKNLMRNSTRYWQMHPETRTNCYELWRRAAQRYADYPAHLVAYDFFNEPAYMHREDWNRIIKDLTQIVRSVDKKHLIVCEAGDGWSQPQWFHWLQPTGDTNTIYSFHHYGKHWGYNYDEYYPGYKSTPEKQMDVLLEAIIFSIRHNVPIHCGEFGVSMISPGDDHLVWLDDYLAMFERFGIGWNWWNWDGTGIYRTGLKAGDEVSPNLKVLQKWIARKKAWN